MEAVVAAAKHDGGDSRHNRLALDMEVAVHFIRSPTADEAYTIGVDATAKHGHGATGTGGAGRDVVGRKVSECWWEESNSLTKEGGHIGQSHEGPRSRRAVRD